MTFVKALLKVWLTRLPSLHIIYKKKNSYNTSMLDIIFA